MRECFLTDKKRAILGAHYTINIESCLKESISSMLTDIVFDHKNERVCLLPCLVLYIIQYSITPFNARQTQNLQRLDMEGDDARYQGMMYTKNITYLGASGLLL